MVFKIESAGVWLQFCFTGSHFRWNSVEQSLYKSPHLLELSLALLWGLSQNTLKEIPVRTC